MITLVIRKINLSSALIFRKNMVRSWFNGVFPAPEVSAWKKSANLCWPRWGVRPLSRSASSSHMLNCSISQVPLGMVFS